MSRISPKFIDPAISLSPAKKEKKKKKIPKMALLLVVLWAGVSAWRGSMTTLECLSPLFQKVNTWVYSSTCTESEAE